MNSNNIDNNITQLLDTGLSKLKRDIIRNMEQSGQSATGTTAKALEHSVSRFHGMLEGAPWTFTLEKGRGSAKRNTGQKAEFVENLKRWIAAKGIPVSSQEDLERLANFFRWYINKFGTKLFREGGRKDIFTPAINEFSDNLAENLSSLYVEEIIKTI
jgi:hypothetical protein